MAWNGFPANQRSAILKKLKLKYKINEPATNGKTLSDTDAYNTSDENIPKIWFRIPFLASKASIWLKKLIRKMQCHLTKPVKFIVI